MNLLYYKVLGEFDKILKDNVLTREHLQSGQININKLNYPISGADHQANFWGYEFKKDDTKYLVSNIGKDYSDIKLDNLLPLRTDKGSVKVSHKGQAYELIDSPVIDRWRPVKSMTPKETVAFLTPFKSSNKKHDILSTLVSIALMFNRIYVRVSTEPGFGKDSKVEIFNSLLDHAGTIENPTVAKLEFMYFYKWLCINEIIDITPGDWRLIEQFLLSAAGGKNKINKRSRGLHGTPEELKIHDLSISLTYNDIDDYPNYTKYFDMVAKRAVKNRFPSLRFHGRLEEEFEKIADINVEAYAKKHLEEFKDAKKNLLYWKLNWREGIHGYNKDALMTMPNRWKQSLSIILDVVDWYSESQEEFNDWVNEINNCMIDYRDMVKFPNMMKTLYTKMGIDKGVHDKWKSCQETSILSHLFSEKAKAKLSGLKDTENKLEGRIKFIRNLYSKHTFTERNKLIEGYDEKKLPQGQNLDSFWDGGGN